MTRIEQLSSFDQLMKLWPRLVVLNRSGLTRREMLQLMLACLLDGAVFVVYGDGGLVGSSCVSKEGSCIILHSLPANGNGHEQLGKTCLEAVEQWAKAQGMGRLAVTTNKLTGSSFKYFEKCLGFRRSSVTFTKELL